MVGNRWLRWAGLVVFCSTICSTLQAQSLPDAPKPKHADRVWLIESATLGSLYAADFALTARGITNGGCTVINGQLWNCSHRPMAEQNPLLGRYPSNAKITAYAGGMWAAESLVLRKTERSRHAWIRWSGRAAFACIVADEIKGIRSWK